MKIIRKLLAGKKAKEAISSQPSAGAAKPRDRRIAARKPARLPATMGFGVSGIPEPVYIRDFNEKGVYLLSNFELEIRATIDIYLTLPAEMTGGTEREVHYVASVLRVEPQPDNSFGVAAVFKRCELMPAAAPREDQQPRRTYPRISYTAPEPVNQESDMTAEEPAHHR